MTPLVSVVVPAYNARQFVSDTLRSVLAQTWPRVEMIVVNDGSQDDTLAVARSFEGPAVKVIDQPNRGAAAARNRGLREAQGEYIQFLDADDLLAPDKVAAQVDRLVTAPGAVAVARWGRFRDRPDDARFVPEVFWRDITPVDLLVEMWERCSMLHPAAWLTPRPVIDKAGPWNEALSLDDDGEFFARVALAADRVLFCEPASYYRSGLAGSLSGSKSDAAWESAMRAAELRAESLLAREDSPRTRRAASRALEGMVYKSYPAVPHLRGQAWKRVRVLGGPYFRPQGGRGFQVAARLVGWKAARLLERLATVVRQGSRRAGP